MEFRNLYSFLRVAEIGNFTKAAEEMGYAQSTVTTQIQQLETELGIPLFERIGKKNMLTVYGQQLIVYANQVMHNVEQMKNIGKTDSAHIRGTLRIGIMESLMYSVLTAVIESFRAQYPNVSLKIRLGVTAELFDLLRRNEVDMIFTMGEYWDTKDCECASTYTANAVFVAGKQYSAGLEEPLCLDQVLNCPLILTGKMTYLYQELSRIAFQHGKDLDSCIQTDSARVVIDLVGKNLGVSLLPEYMVRRALLSEPSGLRILSVPDFSMAFPVHIFYHKNKWMTPQMAGLIGLIEHYWAELDQVQ